MKGFIEVAENKRSTGGIMERFVARKYDEGFTKISKIYDTVAEEYVKIGKDYLVCSTKEEAQEVCNILNKVISFC